MMTREIPSKWVWVGLRIWCGSESEDAGLKLRI